ncbi:DinB family protein [Chitinophaga niastensis]|nr:DinB family protein [Chitinophaga niastensis]
MKEQLLTTLENAKNYTLSVAAAMPRDAYDFKPADAIWTFNELLHHIGYGIYWWEENFIKQKESDWNPPAITAGKDETTAYLTGAFRALKESIGNIAPGDNGIKGFYATMDHITHHRGQATVYLRCKGITPPEYTY